MEIILLLPVLVIGGVWVGNIVWNAILQSSAATKAAVDKAWDDARSDLNGEPNEYGHVIRFRTRLASFRIVQGDEGIGQYRKRFGHCTVEGLPAMEGTALHVLRGDVRFSVPSYLGPAFLDAPTREWLEGSELSVAVEDNVLHVRSPGELRDSMAILLLARFAQRLAERWLDLFAGVLRLAPELGFEATDPRLKLVGTTRLGRSVRRGRVWVLELVGENEGCRVVLRTEDEPILELSFPGLWHAAEHVGQALEAKEMSPGGVYR